MVASLRPWLLVIAITAFGSTWMVAQQRPSLRNAVDVVRLSVTVTDDEGRFVADLSAADFQVLEEGSPQELTLFSPAITPVSVSLLVDTSTSMEEEMPEVQRAVRDFVVRMRSGDLAEVIDFDSRPKVLQPLTGDRSLLASAIRRLRAGGSTSLYNAVYITLRQMAKLSPQAGDEIRRRVVVVLSDGEDTSSLMTPDALVDVAKRAQTTIYVIGLGLAESGELALRHLTMETGGHLFLPKSARDLGDVYTQIATELASQYVLGYVSTRPPDGAWRRVAVLLRRPNLQARTRTGYYTATARPSL